MNNKKCPHCGNLINGNLIKDQSELGFWEAMATSINVMPGPGFTGAIPFISSFNNICPYCGKNILY